MKKLWQSEQPKTERVRGKADPLRTEMEAEAASIDPGSFVQAIGMVDDHVVSCFRHGKV